MTQTNASSLPARLVSPQLQLIQLFLFVPLTVPVLTGDVYEQLPTIMTVKLAPFACECFINFVCTLALKHEKAFITKKLQHTDHRNLTTAFWATRGEWLNMTAAWSYSLLFNLNFRYFAITVFFNECWRNEHLIYRYICEHDLWPCDNLSKVVRPTLKCFSMKDINIRWEMIISERQVNTSDCIRQHRQLQVHS